MSHGYSVDEHTKFQLSTNHLNFDNWAFSKISQPVLGRFFNWDTIEYHCLCNVLGGYVCLLLVGIVRSLDNPYGVQWETRRPWQVGCSFYLNCIKGKDKTSKGEKKYDLILFTPHSMTKLLKTNLTFNSIPSNPKVNELK